MRIALPGTDDLPLQVVPEWEALVAQSSELTQVIDRHLDYESIYQRWSLSPSELCRKKKANLISDAYTVLQLRSATG